MLEKVKNTIEKYKLFSKGERIIVGFSGGIDSLSLLHLLCNLTEYQLDIWAVYINHSLRPRETPFEEKLLEKVGREWGVKTKKIVIDIPTRLKEKPDSIQLLAREERYKIFTNLQKELKADKIALAHHLDDQVETILYRIIRGTGIDGLTGMPIIREQTIIRPLLEVSRQEIAEYAVSHDLGWLEDSSNHKMKYQRNRIRLQLIPLLEEYYNPQVKKSLLRLAKLAAEQRDFMQELVADELPKLLIVKEGKIGLKIEDFRTRSPYLQFQILKKVLSEFRPGYYLETESLERLLSKINQENEHFKPVQIYKGVTVYQEDEFVFFTQRYGRTLIRKGEYYLEAPGEISIESINFRITIREASSHPSWKNVGLNEIYLDADRLSLPLKIRFWQPGDFFWPLGSSGRQKLHDFFINNKVPVEKRRGIPLLVTNDNRIVWVIGYRLDEEFKINSDTKKIWHILNASI